MAMEARMKNLEGMVSGVVQGEMTPAMKREIKSVVREREGELEQRRMDKEDAWERELGVSWPFLTIPVIVVNKSNGN